MKNLLLLSSFWLKLRDYFIEAFSDLGFGGIVILITGIFAGFFLFALIYLIFVLVSFKKNKPKVYSPDEQVNEEEIKNVVDNAVLFYKDNYSSNKINEKVNAIKDITYEEVKSIATLYYPKSKHPMTEISIDEAILLSSYISNRIDELLSSKLIKPFRKYRISQIVKIFEIKKKIDDNKIVQSAKEHHVGTWGKIGRCIVKAINPVFWVRKAIINPCFSLATNKLADVIIRIVGEETAKVYSKSVIKEESEIQELIREFDKDLD